MAYIASFLYLYHLGILMPYGDTPDIVVFDISCTRPLLAPSCLIYRGNLYSILGQICRGPAYTNEVCHVYPRIISESAYIVLNRASPRSRMMGASLTFGYFTYNIECRVFESSNSLLDPILAILDWNPESASVR